MTSITTEHRGFTIVYGENSDEWHCSALDVSAPTLSGIKRKIDLVERKTRQTESIPAFLIDYSGNVEHVTITAKVGKSSKPGSRRYWGDKEGVWCVGAKDGHRKKIELKSCVEDTSENRKLIDEYRRLCDVAKAAQKVATDYRATLPRMAMEAIAPADPEID